MDINIFFGVYVVFTVDKNVIIDNSTLERKALINVHK